MTESLPAEINPSAAAAATTAPPPPTFLERLKTWIWRLIAVVVWAYLITKIFIFDIDTFVVQKYAPDLQWLLDYKFFLLIGLLGVVAALEQWRA